MKYPQSVEMPRQVQDWLQSELEARGIDAVVYTRQILNLLQQHSMDHGLASVWPHIPTTKGVWSNQSIGSENENWDTWDRQESVKRLAVIQCLMSATSQKCDAESLADALCAKLEDFQNGAHDEASTNPFPTDMQPFSMYEAFPPIFCSVVGGELNTPSPYSSPTWARGILRASLDKNSLLETNKNDSDCLSYPYCGQEFMEDEVIDHLFARDDAKRLYERTTDMSTCGIDRVIARLDSTTKTVWNPFPVPLEPPPFLPNQSYFCNKPELFSSAFFAIRNLGQEKTAPPPNVTTWSLGGPQINQPAKYTEEETPASSLKKADLPVMDHTHFKPIVVKCDYMDDGNAFDISPNVKSVSYERSDSGTLFLEAAKYMEYKDQVEEGSDDEFIPKFRVSHSNEKFCQTEESETKTDLCLNPCGCDSPDHSLSDDSELSFSGDDDFAADSDDDQFRAEEEVAQIVAGRLNVRHRAVPRNISPQPEPYYPDEDQMDLNCEGLADLLDCDIVDGDMEEYEEREKSVNSYWPADKIWNPENHLDTCDYCEPHNGSDVELADPLIKGIWGCRVCRDCKDKIATQLAMETAEILKQKMTSHRVVESTEVPSPKPAVFYGFDTAPNINSAEDGGLSLAAARAAWKDTEVEAFPDWGPVVNKDMSVFLEVERVAALKSISAWSPVNQTGVDYLLRKNTNSSLRNLWSPATFEGKEKKIEDPVWVSVGDREREPMHAVAPQEEKPVTHSLMRDEVSHDGDQLLTHLRSLHLEQQDSEVGGAVEPQLPDTLEEDSFPTEPPSPQWGKGRIVNMWAYWNIKTMGNYLNDERFNTDVAQNERKRRHSSSHRPCELYLEGECRRRRCRFLHGDDDIGLTSPKYTLSPSPSPYASQRAFTM